MTRGTISLVSNKFLRLTNETFAGTITGRPMVELEKTDYTITAANEVNSTQTTIHLQILVPPSVLEYQYPSVIYKAGKLDFAGW